MGASAENSNVTHNEHVYETDEYPDGKLFKKKDSIVTDLTTIEHFDAAVANAQFQHLLAMLISHGLPPESAAATCLEIANVVRGMNVSENIQEYADQTAARYEGIAGTITSANLLSSRRFNN